MALSIKFVTVRVKFTQYKVLAFILFTFIVSYYKHCLRAWGFRTSLSWILSVYVRGKILTLLPLLNILQLRCYCVKFQITAAKLLRWRLRLVNDWTHLRVCRICQRRSCVDSEKHCSADCGWANWGWHLSFAMTITWQLHKQTRYKSYVRLGVANAFWSFSCLSIVEQRSRCRQEFRPVVYLTMNRRRVWWTVI